MKSRNLGKTLKDLASFCYFLPPDIFERHKFIGDKIPIGATVLDAGGSLSRLGEFSEAGKITTADIKPPADIVYDGKKIPAKDSSFDVVTSIDVLEHVPKEERRAFLKELVRVSSNLIIISAPYGTKRHIDYEKKILEKYQNKGIATPYLEEHVANGLPTPDELAKLTSDYDVSMFYSGDISLTQFLFSLHNFEFRNKYLNLLFFFLKLFINSIFNLVLYSLVINRPESSNINRFYLVIKKSI